MLRASTPLDLRALRPWARRYDAISVEFLDPDKRKRVEDSLERDYLACGCAAGRLGFGAALALLAITAFVFKETVFAQPAELLAIGAILVLALAALTAMLVALVRARLRVDRVVEGLVRSR